jgi:hypothetical protein
MSDSSTKLSCLQNYQNRPDLNFKSGFFIFKQKIKIILCQNSIQKK